MAPAAHVPLADVALLALPADSRRARRIGSDHHPGGAGQIVVGHSPAVRMATAAVAGAAPGAVVLADAGGRILFEPPPGCSTSSTNIFGFSLNMPTTTARGYSSQVSSSTRSTELPRMITGLRSQSLRTVLRTSRAETRPEPPDADGLVATDPAPPTMSRRGALALVGGGALFVAVLTAGQYARRF